MKISQAACLLVILTLASAAPLEVINWQNCDGVDMLTCAYETSATFDATAFNIPANGYIDFELPHPAWTVDPTSKQFAGQIKAILNRVENSNVAGQVNTVTLAILPGNPNSTSGTGTCSVSYDCVGETNDDWCSNGIFQNVRTLTKCIVDGTASSWYARVSNSKNRVVKVSVEFELRRNPLCPFDLVGCDNGLGSTANSLIASGATIVMALLIATML